MKRKEPTFTALVEPAITCELSGVLPAFCVTVRVDEPIVIVWSVAAVPTETDVTVTLPVPVVLVETVVVGRAPALAPDFTFA